MEISHLSCRLCLSVTDFNVSLFGNYSRKTKLIDKVLVCLKLIIEETDTLRTICYKCTESVERFYDFITFVKKNQTKVGDSNRFDPKGLSEPPTSVNRRHITSYVREEVFDADYTFSFLEMSKHEDKTELKTPSPFYSHFSPPNIAPKPSSERSMWKTPRPRNNIPQLERKSQNDTQNKMERPRQRSRDLFESQSQDAGEAETRCLDWKLTPDKSIMTRIREKCFGHSDF